MTPFRTSFLTFLAQLLASARAPGRNVNTDYDHHVNFARYHIQYWERIQTTDPLWLRRVRDLVDRELRGQANDVLSGDSEKSESKFDQAVNKLLERFPSGGYQ